MARLTKREAIRFLGVDPKQFENYLKYAYEFRPLPRKKGQRYYFDSDELARWRRGYESRVFSLTEEEYNKCLDFALAIHYRGYAFIDWGTARQREFGQKVSNWVKGQLGELAVKHFCRERLGIDIELDFNMHENIVPQDVLSITENGIARKPKFKIGIKSTKPKNAYLVLSQNEVELENRRSDVYILTRIDLPDDHLVRIARRDIMERVRDQQHFHLYEEQIPQFEPIVCEVAGFAYVKDLEVVESIPGQRFRGYRYVKKTGELRRSLDDWRIAFQ